MRFQLPSGWAGLGIRARWGRGPVRRSEDTGSVENVFDVLLGTVQISANPPPPPVVVPGQYGSSPSPCDAYQGEPTLSAGEDRGPVSGNDLLAGHRPGVVRGALGRA